MLSQRIHHLSCWFQAKAWHDYFFSFSPSFSSLCLVACQQPRPDSIDPAGCSVCVVMANHHVLIHHKCLPSPALLVAVGLGYYFYDKVCNQAKDKTTKTTKTQECANDRLVQVLQEVQGIYLVYIFKWFKPTFIYLYI